MELLYVLQLDVEAINDLVDPVAKMNNYICEWLEQITHDTWKNILLEPSGSMKTDFVSRGGHKSSGEVVWETLEVLGVAATRLEIIQRSADTSTEFVTSITVCKEHNSRVVLRVLLGRRNTTELLTPAEHANVFAPRFVSEALRDRELKFTARGQVVNTTFEKIDSLSKLHLTFEALHSKRLLPILFIDTVNAVRLGFAKKSVKALAGMAQVVCLPVNDLIIKYNAEFPAFEIPYSGARLIWPDDEIRADYFSGDELEDEVQVVSQLKNMLYRASALSRGRDSLWATLKTNYQNHQVDLHLKQFQLNLEKASANGDKDILLGLYEQELSESRDQYKALREEHDNYVSEFGTLEEVTRKLTNQETLTAYWMDLATKRLIIRESSLVDIPNCQDGIFEPLFPAIENSTGSSIVFTKNALASWNKSGKPEPELMQKILERLAAAALEWREADMRVGEALDKWLQTRLGKLVPMQDRPLTLAKLDQFEFEGHHYSRSPHIKIKDGTDPSHVMRIYFAVDSAKKRFIVDHVGLKLYGI